MKSESGEQRPKLETTKKMSRGKAALHALYMLAAVLPNVSLPSVARAESGYDYDYSTTYSDFGTDTYDSVETKEERHARQKALLEALGEKPMQMKRAMEDLLLRGSKCQEEADRSALDQIPGGRDMYSKLVDLFANYDNYMFTLFDEHRSLPRPINPNPSPRSPSGYSFSDMDFPGTDFSYEDKGVLLESEIQRLRELEGKIERGIGDVLNFKDADKLLKLLLEDANCGIS